MFCIIILISKLSLTLCKPFWVENGIKFAQLDKMTKNFIKLDWGGFALIEYLLSKKKFKKKFKVLDIGGALGSHSQIMREFGLTVDSIDKYEKDAEFVGDFNTFEFKSKYDMVHCLREIHEFS